MMVRTQITLESELQRRARRRAGEIGVSMAEYVRQLVARDLARLQAKPDVSTIFDLGSSGGSNIALDKDAMIAEAFASEQSGVSPSRSFAKAPLSRVHSPRAQLVSNDPWLQPAATPS
jgi:putative heme degradation protein